MFTSKILIPFKYLNTIMFFVCVTSLFASGWWKIALPVGFMTLIVDYLFFKAERKRQECERAMKALAEPSDHDFYAEPGMCPACNDVYGKFNNHA